MRESNFMPKRTVTQDRALGWWCEMNGLILQMSTHPKYYFKNKETGEITTRQLENLTNEYKAHVKESQKKDSKRSA